MVLASETVIVEIQKFQFIPQQITVKPGTTVRWVNNEKRQYHSVWFEALDKEEPEYFFPDESYERHFANEGSFPYRCGPHPKMTGVVHVRK
ncbi:MAG: plastocyanin/azurin family copper-binding protein [Gammaproteobacteria bacterium]|nr:plastocyanin/azurin family copper-binding protein [Gammaproteobacteria bacterium]